MVVIPDRDYPAWGARQDAAWIAGRLAMVPDAWAGRIALRHAKRMREAAEVPAGRGRRSEMIRAANLWLVETTDRIGAIRVPVGINDAELCDLAETLARECLNLASGVWLKTPGAIRERLARFVAGYGIAPPALPYLAKSGRMQGVEDGPAISRMTDGQWWRRALRRHQARELERAAIGLGYVKRGGEIYASDATVDRRRQQRKRNAAAMKTMTAENLDTGQEFDLGEIAASSVANPRLRRGELMTRLAGFDLVAADLGHVAEFVTLTCPVKFHPYKQDGRRNPEYSGETPRQAHQWLCKAWARCRAKLGRMGAAVYGFRVAEPHKSGTPHWHAVFFMREWLSEGRRLVPRVRAIIRRYFLGDGATVDRRRHGIKFLAIDRAAHAGGAAGYLVKYITKNIDDGFVEQLRLDGGSDFVPAERVDAWASTWGIRQFQQIGGPPVGVWREARRLEAGQVFTDRIDAIRKAADVGQKTQGERGRAARGWAEFVELMGGPWVARCDLPARVAYTRPGERWDRLGQAPYPAPPTRYGETAAPAVYGVRDVESGHAFESRRYRWRINRRVGNGGAGVAGVSDLRRKGGFVVPWREIEDVREVPGVVLVGFELGRESAPWTRVNNCTRRGEDGRIEPVGAGLAPEIRHGGGVERAHGQVVAWAGGENHRGAGGDSGGYGGGIAPDWRPGAGG